MTERDVPSRHEWLPWALPVLFGEEPVLSNPWPALRDALAIFAVQAGAMRDQALNDAASLDGIDSGLLSFELGPWDAWQETTDDFNAPMRVVLMGRTMAGKSSLLAALSGYSAPGHIGPRRGVYRRPCWCWEKSGKRQ